jgi:hypothetical protein
MKKISQQVQEHVENVGSPRVTIEPAFAGAIQQAVDFVNKQYPELLRDVTDIFGHVDKNGLFGEYKTDSPHTIYIDIRNIENEVKKQMPSATDQERQQQIKQQIIKTLLHESTHKKEYGTSGSSSELGPEQAEKAVEPYLGQISSRDRTFTK